MKHTIPVGLATGLALALLLGVGAAAQSTITLGGGAGQTVIFSGQGSGSQSVGVQLGACNRFGDCSLTGSGSGTGSLQSSGSFTLDSDANSILLTSDGHGGYTASAAAPIHFDLTGTANGQTGTLLCGTLNLINFSQASGSGQGTFNTNLAVNLDLGGGLLANAFTSSGGILNLNVQFPTSTSISTLAGTNLSLASSLSANGAGGISPTPEPGTLALVGAGLLVLGAGLRFRHQQALTAA